MRDPVDLDDGIEVAARVIAREFAERPLDLALPRKDPAFEHVFRPGRHLQAVGELHHIVGRTLHRRGHLVFELVVEHRRGRHQQDERIVADGDNDRQILAAGLGMFELQGDVMLRHGLNAQTIAPFHLQPIAAHILQVVVVPIVRVAADDAGFVDEEAAIASVGAEQLHEIEQVHVVVDHDLLPRGRGDFADLARILLVAADELEELLPQRSVLRQTQRHRVVWPGAVDIHHEAGIRIPLDLIKLQRGAALADAGQRAAGRGNVGAPDRRNR